MSAYLKADGSGGDAYLVKNLGGLDEIYLSYTLFVTEALLAAALAAAGQSFHGLFDNTTPGTNDEDIFIADNSGPFWFEELDDAALTSSASAGLHAIEVHAEISTDTLVITIDGTPNILSGDGLLAGASIAQFDELRLGAIFAAADPADISYITDVKAGTSLGASDIVDDDFTGGDFSLWDGTEGSVSIVPTLPGFAPGISLAFDDPSLEPQPVWTRLDSTPNLVASYQIDRGRQFELNRTDGGTATIRINDTDGILDPTNSSGPYFGKIEPLLQISIARWNPVLGEWQTRFRGFIDEYDYSFDPSQRVNFLELSCVDIFAILASIEMQPGQFGDTPPAASDGQVFFDNAQVGDGGRIDQVMGNANIDPAFYVSFSGNVELWETVYSPGESPLTVIQEAADAEFPGVSNVYPDRFGRLVFHGRLAKFDPATIASGVGDDVWDWHNWNVGDGTAVAGSPSTIAQFRQFAMNRGLAQVINSALATPLNIADADVAAQLVTDPTSIGLRGIRSWSAPNLLTKIGLLDSSDALTETKRFATFYVENYAEPRNRVPLLGFRPLLPTDERAAILWRLLCESDIADQINITVASPGGGGLSEEPFFIEGIHETVAGRIITTPGEEGIDDVTMTFDISPAAYFTDNPFPLPT